MATEQDYKKELKAQKDLVFSLQLAHNYLEIEKAMLSCLLAKPDYLNNELFELDENYFFNNHNVLIFQAIKELNSGDIVSISDYIRKRYSDKYTDFNYLVSLKLDTLQHYLYKKYFDLLKALKIRRETIEKSLALQQEAFVIQEAEDLKSLFYESAISLENSNKYEKPKNIFEDSDAIIDNYVEKSRTNQKDEDVMYTGYTQFDSMTGGFRKQQFIVVGARASIGKSAFAVNLCKGFLKQHNVGFISLEMPKKDIFMRFLSIETNIPFEKFRNNCLFPKEISVLSKTKEQLKKDFKQLVIIDNCNKLLSSIKSKCRQLVKMNKVDIIFIDYVGLMQTKDGGKVYEVQSEISGELKEIARELNIPIVGFVQLGRDAEGKKDVNMAHIRGSGSFEQDADIVVLLNRDRYQKHDVNNEQDAEIQIAKNRNGATGKIDMKFHPQTTKFREVNERY